MGGTGLGAEPRRHMVTAALIYANGPVHVGHLAGCYLPADVYARYLRARGREVCFVSGTDEHGAPITLQARAQQCSPQEVVDKYYKRIKSSLDEFGISFDIFSRTSHALHHQEAQAFFEKLRTQNFLEFLVHEQFYDSQAECFLADRYVRGRCVACGYEDAYGDQCEKCGRSLGPEDLEAPRSVLGGKVVKRKTGNWYLSMGRWQSVLEKYIHSKEGSWRSHVLGQCRSWLGAGFRPRAMTRDLGWGVKLPDAAQRAENLEQKEAANKVLYVWFEAPIGYLSATKELYADKVDKGEELWKSYWQGEETRISHFIGKDNIVFHCLIFPLMLHLHGGYRLPDVVPANQFLNLEGEKLSTSRGWVVWLSDYLKDFPDQQDALRYYLLARLPENKDSNFSWSGFQEVVNKELVGGIGNFVNRSLHLAHKYCQGQIPEPSAKVPVSKRLAQKQQRLLAEKISACLEGFRFEEALSVLKQMISVGDKYLSCQEPWKKDLDNDTRQTILYDVLQWMAALCVYSAPFLPTTASALAQLINLDFSSLGKDSWQSIAQQPILSLGHPLNPPTPLLKRIEDSDIAHQEAKLEALRAKTN